MDKSVWERVKEIRYRHGKRRVIPQETVKPEPSTIHNERPAVTLEFRL